VKPTKAMQAGLAQESKITEEYLTVKGNGVTVQKCGFFVCESHPFLGASPDGIVNDNGDTGLIEMKYIQQSDDETLNEALIRKRICINNAGNTQICMNTKHKYYYQVQHQMYVTSKQWTDFVV